MTAARLNMPPEAATTAGMGNGRERANYFPSDTLPEHSNTLFFLKTGLPSGFEHPNPIQSFWINGFCVLGCQVDGYQTVDPVPHGDNYPRLAYHGGVNGVLSQVGAKQPIRRIGRYRADGIAGIDILQCDGIILLLEVVDNPPLQIYTDIL